MSAQAQSGIYSEPDPNVNPEPQPRIQPHSNDSEKAVLGSLLFSPELLEDFLGVLDPKTFFRPAHQTIFQGMLDCFSLHGKLDIILLANLLRESNQLKGCGGMVYLTTLAHCATSAVHAHAKLILEKASMRQLIDISTRSTELGYTPGSDLSSLIDDLEVGILDLRARQDPSGALHIGDLAQSVVMDAEAAYARKGKLAGLSTGFEELDKLTSGACPGDFIVFAGRPAMGKAQPLSAQVLAPTGFRAMGDLAVGDLVVGPDGNSYPISGIFPQGEKEVFRVTMSDGTATECCKEHLWFTQDRSERRRNSPGSVKPLYKIMQTLSIDHGFRRNHKLPDVSPIQFDKGNSQSLDPYLVGLILGDGTSNGSVILHNSEPDVQRMFIELLPSEDVGVMADRKTCRVSRLIKNNQPSETKKRLVDYDLSGKRSFEKFIPNDYLFGTVDERISILQGLVDTDGYVVDSGQSIEYTTSSEQLAHDICFLVRSLGGIISCRRIHTRYSYKGKKLIGRDAFRMNFWFKNGIRPFRSIKHASRWKSAGQEFNHRMIVSVEAVGKKPCQCIMIDSQDHIYLTDDFIPTHNTAFGLRICRNVAAVGDPVGVLSLEMPGKQLTQRVLCSEARVDLRRFRNGELEPFEWKRIIEAAEWVQSLPLYMEGCDVLDPFTFRAKAKRLKREKGIKLLLVDYLQLMADPSVRRNGTRTDELSGITRMFKRVAQELEIPVIGLSQLSREVEKRPNKRPVLSDLRESGSIEQDADTIGFLYRASYYFEQQGKPVPIEEMGRAECNIAKQRNGPTGRVRLAFTQEFARFDNL